MVMYIKHNRTEEIILNIIAVYKIKISSGSKEKIIWREVSMKQIDEYIQHTLLMWKII